MKELFKRISLPIPVFFAKVRNLGGAITGLGVVIMAMDYEGSRLLDFIKPFGIEMVVAGAVMVAISQLTVKPEVPNIELTKSKNEK
jgi:Na+/H+ antiporter NhaD/arsenite permease-like protein